MGIDRDSVGVKLNKLLKDLRTERVQGSSAVLNYSNFDYWVNWDDIVEIVENHKQPSLNKNQQVVVEQLCLIYDKQIYKSKMQAIYIFINGGMSEEFLMLDKKESDQVLQAFAEWGMKEVAE